MEYGYPPSSCGEVAELNFQGVIYLRDLNIAGAIKNFSRGLRIIQVHLNHAAMLYSSGKGPTGCPHHFDEQEMLFSVAVSDPETTQATRKGSCFALYRRALHVSLENLPYPPSSSIIPCRCCHLMAGILMYNLGLAHHHEALRRGDSQMLSRTLDFYAFADSSLTLASSSMGNLGALAIANNMCHIFASHHKLRPADTCVQDFFERLFVLVRRHSVSDEDEQYKVFLQNVTCYLTGSKFLSAPAA